MKKTDLEKHNENPFSKNIGLTIKTRKKRMTVSKGTGLLDLETGELEAETTDICQIATFDKEPFIKIFTSENWGRFSGLSLRGYRMLFFVFCVLQKTTGEDRIFLHHSFYEEDFPSISKETYYGGLAELLENGFLAQVEGPPGWFYINPCLYFNGDRVRYAKALLETSKKASNPTDEEVAKSEEKTLDFYANKPEKTAEKNAFENKNGEKNALRKQP